MNAPHKHDHKHTSPRKSVHKPLLLLIGVALMIIAMAAYVFTVDESIEPEVELQEQRVPAAAGP